MPLPTGTDMHVNSLLTNLSVGWMTDPSLFIAADAFPVVQVQKQTGLYAEFDRGDFLRDEAQVRAPATKAAGGGYKVTTTSRYDCEVYSWGKYVADQDRDNSDDPFKPDQDAGMYLVQKRRQKEEVAWTTAFFGTGIWTGSTTTTDLVAGTDFTAWTDPASDLIGDVDLQSTEIESNTGQTPNTLVVNRRGWNAIKRHPDIIERLKGMGSPERPAIANQANVAAILELDRVLIARAPRNTAAEGATDATDYIAGNHALLCYSAPSPSLNTPSAGYTFRWTPQDGEGGAVVETYRDDRRKADWHEINFAFQHKVVSAICGAFFQNVA